ncbi:GspH/FimT family pseudopilin [Xanthomonas hortorum]|uniref:Type II secretion system protein H n=2 Tax=Xanthomonas hortorum TaxID=56454 RepID=A0A6V7CSW7_9XANT|nr:GspH/FimT family pseudopilin [Xanthomonas hortorum]MCC4625374.1 GspH/FimT family pseudopilin [Xanthomonas campestris pv. nigromaculans]APP81201.1 prepilin [Xanthomonas hortorum pv. gardneri]MCC8498511.1 GspH/FimT family pseudopilin [Xanthomonas hortorum pv. gardneri]MCC8508368.1 GspH/FimT family pseudopilin [Xanthomonas hortorum pv. gardneri]MCC8510884.1 GspH/FimT family pseudopilin [Xanthomonas hortorum pv. gardneri]
MRASRRNLGEELRCARHDGFSLIELMVTVAVLAIVAAIAIPSFTGLINSNRLTASANEVLASLQMTRSEAVRRNQTVLMCPSSDASSCSSGSWNQWIVMVKATNEVLRVGTARAPMLVQASPAIVSNGNAIEFRSDGLARSATGSLLAAAVSSCLATTNPPQNVRLVVIVSGSRAAVRTGTGDATCAAPVNAPTTL